MFCLFHENAGSPVAKGHVLQFSLFVAQYENQNLRYQVIFATFHVYVIIVILHFIISIQL